MGAAGAGYRAATPSTVDGGYYQAQKTVVIHKRDDGRED